MDGGRQVRCLADSIRRNYRYLECHDLETYDAICRDREDGPQSGAKGMRHVLVLVAPASHARLDGIARYARQHRWRLTVLDRLDGEPSGWSGDGALTTMRNDGNAVAFVKAMMKKGAPVVDLTLNHPEIDVPRVSGDHFAMGRMARDHFEARNLRHFAWFSTEWLNVHRLRYEGFSTKADGRRDRRVPRWVLSDGLPDGGIGDFERFDGWLGEKLRNASKPLGLLAYDDADAARALGACLAAGIKVPRDVAIIGIGGDRMICENQAVPLSSVEHELERTGYEGARLLDRLMDGGKPPKEPMLVPAGRITVRMSTDVVAATSMPVRMALEYIRTHIDKPFGMTQVADAIGVSRSTLNRLFQRETGRSIGDEIMRRRLEISKRFLGESPLTIAEIAYRAGFCNPAYLTNTFLRSTGMTPKEWRASAVPAASAP